jgi:hypothetical protein
VALRQAPSWHHPLPDTDSASPEYYELPCRDSHGDPDSVGQAVMIEVDGVPAIKAAHAAANRAAEGGEKAYRHKSA